ncbi:MAG: bifunctional riboflavin kinase/FAD synthetase [Clostridiales bacterium]|nr:bifunctional riboflavin kinase/FAD synthetase [Clostridiales bacterium]
MPFIYDFNRIEEKGTVVALGNFDGVHIGHLNVLYQTQALADKLGVKPSALIFKEHPHINKNDATKELLTLKQKDEAFSDAGIENIYLYNFEDVCNMTAEQFVKEILKEKLNAKGVCCGFNYHFGKNASGDAQMLVELCKKYKIEANVCPEVKVENGTVSSSRIRKAIENGNLELANKMLGKVFCYDFVVVDGDKRGRLLGAPTINQYFPESFVVPKNGVYASRCFVDGRYHAAVTNVGIRPSIEGTSKLRSETCIMDFSGDLYGQNIEVGLLQYLRPEKKFESLEKLSEQISIDAKNAKKIFADFEVKHNEEN